MGYCIYTMRQTHIPRGRSMSLSYCLTSLSYFLTVDCLCHYPILVYICHHDWSIVAFNRDIVNYVAEYFFITNCSYRGLWLAKNVCHGIRDNGGCVVTDERVAKTPGGNTCNIVLSRWLAIELYTVGLSVMHFSNEDIFHHEPVRIESHAWTCMKCIGMRLQMLSVRGSKCSQKWLKTHAYTIYQTLFGHSTNSSWNYCTIFTQLHNRIE